jgi:UDP-2,3-diacylglucosamine pyrophosphatase LpxH
VPADRPVWVVSDLHLGDGSPTDAFCGKDELLLEVVEQARAANARLVINGDAIDFAQAGDLTPVVRAHGPLLRALSDMAARGPDEVVYVLGNHDDDFHVYSDLLRFRVCTRLYVGDDIVIEHGHRFDPWIGEDLRRGAAATALHHALERWLGTWLRLPLQDFYTPANRAALWLCHKYAVWLRLSGALLHVLGLRERAARRMEVVEFWTRNEAGDPMKMALPALEWAKGARLRAVVCGHSHMPGLIERDGSCYVNTGSWTFGWAALTTLHEGRFEVRDVRSGRVHTDTLYRRLLEGHLDALSFERWWRNEYLGWFRFRSAEARRARRTATHTQNAPDLVRRGAA